MSRLSVADRSRKGPRFRASLGMTVCPQAGGRCSKLVPILLPFVAAFQLAATQLSVYTAPKADSRFTAARQPFKSAARMKTAGFQLVERRELS